MARIKFYALKVARGVITIDDVPEDIRDDVIEYLEHM